MFSGKVPTLYQDTIQGIWEAPSPGVLNFDGFNCKGMVDLCAILLFILCDSLFTKYTFLCFFWINIFFNVRFFFRLGYFRVIRIFLENAKIRRSLWGIQFVSCNFALFQVFLRLYDSLSTATKTCGVHLNTFFFVYSFNNDWNIDDWLLIHSGLTLLLARSSWH